MSHMKTATVRQLRNEFPRLEALVREGETVYITKRGKDVAMLVPPQPKKKPGKLVKPDIMARLKETWGDRFFSDAEVKAMRDDEREWEYG